MDLRDEIVHEVKLDFTFKSTKQVSQDLQKLLLLNHLKNNQHLLDVVNEKNNRFEEK